MVRCETSHCPKIFKQLENQVGVTRQHGQGVISIKFWALMAILFLIKIKEHALAEDGNLLEYHVPILFQPSIITKIDLKTALMTAILSPSF